MAKAIPAAKQPAQPSVALTRASTTLQGTVAQVEKVVADLQALVTVSSAMATKIEDQQAESAAIAAENEVARREAAAELRLQVKEDRAAVTSELLAEAGLARITQAEVDAIRADLAAKVAADDKELKTAVAIAVQAEKRDALAAAAQVDAANKVAAAQKDATISMQEDKIKFLGTQVQQLQAQIEAERTTRLEIARAEAQKQGVVVNNGK